MARVVCGEANEASSDGVAIYLDGTGADAWSGLPPTRVGAATSEKPDAVVVAGTPERRFDIYCYRPAPMFAFEARPWAGWLAVGFGDRVTLVSLADKGQREHRLDSYFGGLHE